MKKLLTLRCGPAVNPKRFKAIQCVSIGQDKRYRIRRDIESACRFVAGKEALEDSLIPLGVFLVKGVKSAIALAGRTKTVRFPTGDATLEFTGFFEDLGKGNFRIHVTDEVYIL